MKVGSFNRVMRASILPIFCLMLLGFISNSGSADPLDTVTVTIPDTSTTPGDTIDIPIRVNDVTHLNIGAFGITLTYYDSILTADSAYTTGTIAEGWGPPYYGITPGQINIAMAKWFALSGSGPLVYVRFIVDSLASPGDTTPLHLAHVTFNEGDPAARPHDGTFTVVGPEIAVSPTSFGLTLCVGSTKDSTLTISNIGNASLIWNLTESPAVGWLDENPTGGSINPYGHTDVSVQFDANGLSPGTYNDTLVITSNALNEPIVHVPVQLVVIPPDIRVLPTSFNDTLCTADSTKHTLTVYNDGVCPLVWNITENPAVGWLSEDPTNGSVSAGDSQGVTLTFDATGLSPGTYNDTLVITSNDPDEPTVTVPVQLVVIAPDIRVLPTSFIDTLCRDDSTKHTLTIYNDGVCPLVWNIVESPAVGWLSENPTNGSVSAGGSQGVTLTFDATGLSSGTYNDTLVITSNDPDAPTVNVPVQLVVIVPDISILPISFDDTLCTDEDTTHTLTIYNDGECPLTWNITENPAVGWLSEDPTNGSVSAGDSQGVTLTFDATGLSPDTYNDTLVITSNDPDEPTVNIPVQLIVPASDIRVLPTSLHDTLCTDDSSKHTLTIYNDGKCPLTWNIAENPAVGWLSEDPTSGSVSAGGSKGVTLTFDASGLALGTYNDTLVITSNDPDEPTVNVPVQLVVLCPGINVSPDSIDYGCLTVGTTKDSVLIVRNTGDAALTVDSIVSSNPTIFIVIYGSGFPETIDVGDSIKVTVRFSPDAGIAYRDSLMIASDDPDNPILWVLVTGRGNNIPTITSTPITMTVEDNLYSYDVQATDPDGDTLNYSLLVNPHWLSINESTGVVSGTPTNADVGDTIVTVKVYDVCAVADTQTYALSVTNAPPHITSTPDTLAWEDALYTYNVESDDEGQGGTYYAFVVNPHWLHINSSTGVISGAPTNDDIGDTTVTVQVIDGNGGVDDQSYMLHVINTNDLPYQPSNPSPSDWATNQPINVNLYWSGGDPDPFDTVTYQVYFGTSPIPPYVGSVVHDTTYDLGTLDYYTQYWWKIIAIDKYGMPVSGPIWTFLTGGGSVAGLVLTAADSTVVVSNYTKVEPLYVAVTDQGGHAAASQIVTFNVSAGGGIVNPDTVVTNGLGKATTWYYSSPTAAIYTVTATCNPVSDAVPIKQVHDMIAQISLTPEVYRVHAGRQIVPIRGELQDKFGNHVDASSPNDITFTKLIGRGSLGSPYLDTIDNEIFTGIVYITYTGGVDTAKIEGRRGGFADTSVVISLATTGYVIGGYVRTTEGSGVENVEMRLSGDASDTTFTDVHGYYQFVDLLTGIHTVIPTKSGWTFNPSRRDYTPLNSDMMEQNFTGIAPCEQWQVKLTISGCGGLTQERFFGAHCFATDGYDEDFDIPCPPPGFQFHSYFYISEDPCYLSTDIKAPNAPLCWTLKIVNADGCIDTLRWDPAELPETALLLNGMDMHSESLAIYEGDQTLRICGRLDTFDIPMTGICGWTLASVPVIPLNKDVNAVFPGNCGVFTWDPFSGNYIMPAEVEPDVGYWVCYATPCTIRVIGIPVTTYTRGLETGWSLIGSLAEEVDFTDPEDDPDGSIVDGSLYGLNPVNCSYVAASTIEPTQGYWVCASQPCDLTVSNTHKSKSVGMGLNPPSPQGDLRNKSLLWTLDLSIENNDASYGPPIILRLGNMDAAVPELSTPLPPSLPGTVFDAWFDGQNPIFKRLAVDIRESSNSNWTVSVKAPHGFTINWNPLNIPDNQILTLIDGSQEINMKTRTAHLVKDTNGKLISIKIKATSVHGAFELLQITPNPFENTTNIDFRLPKKTRVTLTIYNVMGQKVCQLLNMDVDAGHHTVCWEGVDDLGKRVEEGIYFYQIKTDSYVNTGKMILLR